MKRKLSLLLTAILGTGCIFLLVGCMDRRIRAGKGNGETVKENESSQILSSVEALYGYQRNFANGTALLNLIPENLVRDLYDNYDALKAAGEEKLPVQLREYAVTDTVYFDYETDCSIVWNRSTGDVRIERTDTEERDAFRQKQHKE